MMVKLMLTLMMMLMMMMMMTTMIIKIKSILCDDSDESIWEPDFLREIILSLSLLLDLLISLIINNARQ